MVDVTKKISLNLNNIDPAAINEVKEEVGEFVKDNILRSVAGGKSPVAGESFSKLSKAYAKNEKGGDRTPNLELEGDLLDALEWRSTADGIEIGVFEDSGESEKADGHNKHTGRKNNLPKRRFIPVNSQRFDKSIQTGIQSILAEFRQATKVEEPVQRQRPEVNEATTPSGQAASLTLNDLLEEDDLLNRLFNEG